MGHDWREEECGAEAPVPYPVDRMKPRRDRTKEGRANPKGIPYLYTANDKETAIAEVRPWIGAYVSIAELKVVRPLTIVNCTHQDATRLTSISRNRVRPKRKRRIGSASTKHSPAR